MPIGMLHIQSFRNIESIQVAASPNLNLVIGDNGSGKTSLLEAIYLLGYGRSFRSNKMERVITHGVNQLVLFAIVDEHRVGLSKSRSGETQLKIDGEVVRTQAPLSQLLPVQLIHPEGYGVVNGSPKHRRAFLDWGVFHMEHSYYELTQRFKRVLKQRNALLKRRSPKREVAYWDEEFVQLSLQVNDRRQSYFNALRPIVEDIAESFLPEYRLDMTLQPGWTGELKTVLESGFERDVQLGYTQLGPQKADIRIRTESGSAADCLSRGQMKLLVCALLLAQGQLAYEQYEKPTVYLIDDFAAELDQSKRKLLADYLQRNKAQVFVSAIEQHMLDGFDLSNCQVFHVKHGGIINQETRAEHG
jgi:DNA replication and repair protein RecF